MIGMCLAIWLAEGSLTGPASPPFAETEPAALADLSATLILGAIGFSGLALFNRRLRLAGIGRAIRANKTERR